MERQLAALALNTTRTGSTSSYPVDPTWYADIAATDHFTNDLHKMTTAEQYNGKDLKSKQPMVQVCALHILVSL